jgi:hypothetical protein
MGAVVPDGEGVVELVGLLDGGDGRGHVPEVFDRDVVAYAAEFALEADASGVEGAGETRVEGGAALRVRVVVVVAVVAGAVIEPAGCCVDEAGGVQLADEGGERDLGVGRGVDLAPTFVVDDLFGGGRLVLERGRVK